MTAIQFVLIAIGAFIVLAGLFMVIRSFKQKQDAEVAAVQYDKNGIPIIPRHERDIIDEPDFDDTVAGETVIGPDRDYLNTIVEEEPAAERHSTEYRIDETQVIQSPDSHGFQDESADKDNTQDISLRAQAHEGNTEVAHSDEQRQTGHEQEFDAFSSLMSATDNLMPVIETAEEPSFEDNSPILDQHLLEPVDEAQNSPLLNAKDNINITILPNQYRDRPQMVIRGRDLLELVDKYGLRFGAMNMFHRYEQKDGTGMLWFSMMGITENGIAPFDPHRVATNIYHGVVVFLSLPHPQALRSFDSMMSIAYMMADDLNAMILDENNEPITPEYKQQLRNQVRDYGV